MGTASSTHAYDTLRAELIKARKRAGVHQRDVAAQLGKHQQFRSKVESGERRLDVVELITVAPLLNLDLSDLLRLLNRVIKSATRNG